MFDLAMSALLGEEGLKDEETRKKWNPIINRSMESLDEEERYVSIDMYSSKKDLFYPYMENQSGLVWSVKKRAYLDVWLGRLRDRLILITENNDKNWITNSKG